MSYTIRVIQNIIFVIIGIFVMPIFYQKLGPNGLGEISYIDSIATIFSIFAGYGVARYGTREISKNIDNDEEKYQIYRGLRSFSIKNHIIVTIVYGFVLLLPVIQPVNIYLFLISFISVNRNLFNVDWYFEAHQRFNLISVKNIIIKVFLISILFVFLDSDIFESYYYFLTAGFPFISFIVVYAFFKFGEYKGSIKNTSREPRNYYSNLLPSLLLSNSYLLFFQADKVILGTRDISEVGNYSLTERIILLIFPIIMSLMLVNVPKLTKLFSTSKEKYLKELDGMLCQLYCIVIPISCCIFFYSKDIIVFIGGTEFIESETTLEIFSITLFFMSIWRYLTSSVFYVTSNEWKCFIIIVSCGFINIISKLIFNINQSEQYVIITLVMHVLVIVLLLLYSNNVMKVRINYNFIYFVKYIALTMVLIYFSQYIDFATNYLFIIKIIITAIVYCMFLLLSKDKHFLKLIR